MFKTVLIKYIRRAGLRTGQEKMGLNGNGFMAGAETRPTDVF